jgi:prepilin-type N-terminal cleavage/methylation domain-containing protein
MLNKSRKFKKPLAISRKPYLRSGFTLIETLVAFTIFGLLVGVITSSLLTVFRSHRYVFNALNSQANLRFVLETMTREIKEGSSIDFNPETKTLSFLNKDNQAVDYYLEGGAIIRKQGAEVLPITFQDLTIDRFDIAGCWQDPDCQPSITLLFLVRPKINPQKTSFYLQTTITQRRAGI